MPIQIVFDEEELKTIITDCIKNEFQHFAISQKSEPEELLTSKQSAKVLGVSLPTLFKWRLEGRVNSFRIASRIRFKRSDLLAALQSSQGNKKAGNRRRSLPSVE